MLHLLTSWRTHLPYTYHIHTIYLPYTYHILTIYLPYTYQAGTMLRARIAMLMFDSGLVEC